MANCVNWPAVDDTSFTVQFHEPKCQNTDVNLSSKCSSAVYKTICNQNIGSEKKIQIKFVLRKSVSQIVHNLLNVECALCALNVNDIEKEPSSDQVTRKQIRKTNIV